jgi:hypothetical protein
MTKGDAIGGVGEFGREGFKQGVPIGGRPKVPIHE